MRGDSTDENGSSALRSPAGSRDEPELEDAFDRIMAEGRDRLGRPLLPLAATGLLGGVDVAVGVLAYLVVEHETGQPLLASAAFTIGFIALLLARSELFTENFLVPVTAVAARRAPWWSVLRLWVGTGVMNLVGGWVAMGLVMMAFPLLRQPAVAIGSHPAALGINRGSFASAVIAGAAITLMTWMERGTESVPAKIASAWAIAFVLAAAPLHHAIVISVEIFAALHAGAPFGYADWLGALAWASFGNIIGGIGLVTMLRLVQVGMDRLEEKA
jgi:formate/nitrite transporter FocA (FNT family)